MKLTAFKDCFLFDRRFYLDLIFPNRCPFCREIIDWREYSCVTCEEKLPFIDKKLCPRCGKENCLCTEKEIFYDRCYSVVWYEDSIRNAVVRFKSECPDNFAAYFAFRLSELIAKDNLAIDFVTAVPASAKTLRKRGYNQAAVLGKALARRLKLPFYTNVLGKKNTQVKQHDLSMSERAEFVKGLYSFNDAAIVRNKRILLCDDIITTGSTLNACAKLLKINGAAEVYCAVAANTNHIDNKM